MSDTTQTRPAGTPAQANGAPHGQTTPAHGQAPPAHGQPQHAPPGVPHVPPTEPKRAGRRRLILGALVLVVLVAGSVVGYRYYYDSTHFVATDNALLTGRLIQ